jgi:hypothetical protein
VAEELDTLISERGVMVRILLVEDEIKLGNAVSEGLRAEGTKSPGRRPGRKVSFMPARKVLQK